MNTTSPMGPGGAMATQPEPQTQRMAWLENLVSNIPGGVHECLWDEGLTLTAITPNFLEMVGYNAGEIEQRLENQFARMIVAEDLPRVREQINQQLAFGQKLEVEYRVRRADGQMIWALAQGKMYQNARGQQVFCCMLIDITRQREEREQLWLALERHQLIMDQTTDIIFEWDIDTDVLSFSSNWKRKFGYDPIDEHFSTRLALSQNVHPEDLKIMVQLMETVTQGAPYAQAEVRIRDQQGQYLWCRLRATTQFDAQGQPIKVVGVVIDISQEKKQQQELMEMARRDSLTGLYNKAAMKSLTQQHLDGREGTGYQALMIIDIDDFKAVNDTYGHLCGDGLLADVASVLRTSFRASDLIGRIGGDEFLAYLPEASDEEAVRCRVQGLLDALQSVRPAKDAAPISCSIGVALFPYGAADYFTLYQYADRALYQRKHQGKGGVTFYDPAICSDTLPAGVRRSAVSEAIDSEINAVNEKLAQYAFRMLYNTVATEAAVNQILEIVGLAYGVSRVYIFENSEDGLHCNNTFEWCNAGIQPEIENLQNLSYEKDLGDYLANFDERGVFYCRDISQLHPDLYQVLAPQGIRSMLQCAIRDDGQFQGYVGFDECQENRLWTREQVESLTLIANVLSTFLLKLRLKERLARLEQ